MTATPEQMELREAATFMREQHGPDHPRHEMWFALADLLEHAALTLESTGHTPSVEYALHVARAYLAAVPRANTGESL